MLNVCAIMPSDIVTCKERFLNCHAASPAMGRRTVLLLLLAFLTARAAIPVPLALRALNNLHRSASFTSRPAVPKKYTVHYLEQKLRS
ncbi:lysosomal Pro-X carboxypeptidase-like isoform X2 [Suricata suricatta]|uniref:lysosomal Pro-X carboxypeptidase-like isoform X2 n=1 Tax=Suricata suricatta TaxID=37032 RepID=UPI0011563D15|nr:lysosomal Pro-X carboxypeptidase-like isoform X2 [Suricata suricatta]